jgi:hypothetical protein
MMMVLVMMVEAQVLPEERIMNTCHDCSQARTECDGEHAQTEHDGGQA